MARGRPLLKTIMALGCVVSLAGATGVFAVFTDRATTGTNSFESADRARAADLQLAEAEPAGPGESALVCGTFVDDLVTGVLSATDISANGSRAGQYLCLRNAGSAAVDVTTSVFDVLDSDSGCTGDEGVVDATCGGDAAGELAQYLVVVQSRLSCADGGFVENAGPASFDSMVDTPLPGFSLAPDETACFYFVVSYPADEAQALESQSDTVTWRFAFDGSTT